jgi:hypothetical protein
MAGETFTARPLLSVTRMFGGNLTGPGRVGHLNDWEKCR